MGLRNEDRQFLKGLLHELVREGKVIKVGSRFWVPDGKKQALIIKRKKTQQKNLIEGRLAITSRGFGFVTAKSGQEYMIPERELNRAKHRDIVEAEKTGPGWGGRTMGRITRIVSPGIQTLVGVFENRGTSVAFHPFDDLPLDRRDLIDFPKSPGDGMVGRWDRRADGYWVFRDLLGRLDDPRVDEIVALAENGIQTEFYGDVLTEANTLSGTHVFELGSRRDFRDELVFTVDGATARDFDDALHFRELGRQQIEVGIHIADVSEFVTAGSAMDRFAALRGNSVYLPHKAFPMLPPVLSEDLCSLKPGEPRYTLSVLVRMTMHGKIVSFSFCKGLIQSKYRLTYDDVAAIGIDRDEQTRARFAEVAGAIDLGLRLSRKMRSNRIKAGGLKLDLAEMVVVLNETQALDSVRQTRQNDANRLVEAFMCLANECAASRLADYGIPFRIHEPPDPEKLQDFSALLESFQIQVPPEILERPGVSLNQIIDQLTDQPHGQVLQTQLLRTLKLAEYSTDNRGHFGLHSEHYAHFTSPIRRYADLLTHRRLSRLLEEPDLGPEHFDDESLEEICAHISKTERAAARAEQIFTRMKVLRHLVGMIGSDFDGNIVEIKSFGLFVELIDWGVSGLIPLEEIGDDVYEYVPEILGMIGRQGGKLLRVGHRVRVKAVRIDLIGRKLDLTLIEGGEDARSLKIAIPRKRDRSNQKARGRSKDGSRQTGSRQTGSRQTGSRQTGRDAKKGRPKRNKVRRTLGRGKVKGRKK